MKRREALDMLQETSLQLDEFMSWSDGFIQEKIDWLKEVLNEVCENAKHNGFNKGDLPKTPRAVKRTRKRVLSTIVEDDIVEVPVEEPRIRGRTRRQAALEAKKKISGVIIISPDDQATKKRKKNEESVSFLAETSIHCPPSVVLITPLKVKKELTFMIDRESLAHDNESTSRSSVTVTNSDSPSLQRLEVAPVNSHLTSVEEVNASENCVNDKLKIKVEVEITDKINRNTRSSLKSPENTNSPVEQNLNYTYNKSSRKELEPSVLSNEVLNITYDRVNDKSVIQDMSSTSQQKVNCSYNLKSKKSKLVPTKKLDDTFILPNTEMTPPPSRSAGTSEETDQMSSLEIPLNITLKKTCDSGNSAKDVQVSPSHLSGPTVTSSKDLYNDVSSAKADEISHSHPNGPIATSSEQDDETGVFEKGEQTSPHVPVASLEPVDEADKGEQSSPPVPVTSSGLVDETDDSGKGEESSPSPRKQTNNQTRNNRPVCLFSPKGNYQPSPAAIERMETVRKRVEAYENMKKEKRKLNPEPVQETRVTRTKTRAQAAAALAAKCEPPEDQAVKKNKPISDEDTSRKLLPKSKKETYNESEKENSMVQHTAKGGLAGIFQNSFVLSGSQSERKNPPRMPPAASQVLGEINNISLSANKANSSHLKITKPGLICSAAHTFINKVPVKPSVEEKIEEKLERLKRREEKEAEAALKKEEILREKIEAQRRKREEKMKRVHEARRAQEKEKQEQQRLLLEGKNQRTKLILQENEAKLKGEVNKKKMQTQQKLADVEERRKLDELARLAKLKEQEEEQLLLQAARKREQEEAERQHQKRLGEEREAAVLREKAEQQAKTEAKLIENLTKAKKQIETSTKAAKNAAANFGYKSGKIKMLPKSVNDYGLDEINSDDPSDNENSPKKYVPKWAQKKHRTPAGVIQSYLPKDLEIFQPFMKTTLNPSKLFPTMARLKRTSSAIWLTPPLYK